MMNLEEAREHLLNQIELQMCCIYEAGSEAPTKLQEFFDYVKGLPITHHIFQWYLINDGNTHIEFIDGAVQISKVTDSCSEFMGKGDDIDDLIWEALENRN